MHLDGDKELSHTIMLFVHLTLNVLLSPLCWINFVSNFTMYFIIFFSILCDCFSLACIDNSSTVVSNVLSTLCRNFVCARHTIEGVQITPFIGALRTISGVQDT